MVRKVFVYNPTCEMAVANGDPNYDIPKRLKAFKKELSLLVTYFANKYDIVITETPPSEKFLNQFSDLDFDLPQFSSLNRVCEIESEKQSNDLYLQPWGWSPSMHKRLGNLKLHCNNRFINSKNYQWNNYLKEIYSRKSALKILSKLYSNKRLNDIVDKTALPMICESEEEVLNMQKKWKRVILKSPWSSSGRGIQVLRENEFNRTNHQWLKGILSNQGYVMAEPFHNKVADCGFHFEITENEIKFHGVSHFITGKKGEYEGNLIGDISGYYPDRVVDFIKSNKNSVISALTEAIKNSDYFKYYEGYLGVDVLIYEDSEQQLKLVPCLEINCRLNMGILSLHLEKLICTCSKAQWFIKYMKKDELQKFHTKMLSDHPLIFKQGKIESGYFALSDVWKAEGFLAYMVVG